MRKKPLGLRRELIFFCIVILMVSLLLQVVFNLFFAKSMALLQKEKQIETLYTALVSDYSDDEERIYNVVSQAQDVENLRVHIAGPSGVVFTTDPFTSRNRLPESGQEAQHIMPAPKAETNLTVVELEQTFIYDGEYRTIYIWSSVAAIDTSVELFTQSSIIVSCLVMGFAAVWVVFYSKRITKPILEIDRVAQNVANLQFQQRADEGATPAELGSLAVSINTMSENLEQMIGRLNADNKNLVVQVEQAQKLEQMRRQFIANISHEMKTPLSMLMMYSESLRDNIPGIDKTYYYDTIIQEASDLNVMVGQLLDISSIENGLVQLHSQPVCFSEFVNAILDKQAPLFQNRILLRQIAPDLWCNGDEKYLEQALGNYLSNALTHSQEGDTIEVTLAQAGAQLVLSVKNPGQPIAPEDLPHIWESFYRADQARTQNGQKRVGLGLYIVKTCIQAHGGSVHVEHGEGTVTFSFTLDSIDAQ